MSINNNSWHQYTYFYQCHLPHEHNPACLRSNKADIWNTFSPEMRCRIRCQVWYLPSYRYSYALSNLFQIRRPTCSYACENWQFGPSTERKVHLRHSAEAAIWNEYSLLKSFDSTCWFSLSTRGHVRILLFLFSLVISLFFVFASCLASHSTCLFRA